MHRTLILSLLFVSCGYCAIDKDFKDSKQFIKSLGNQVQNEASRFDTNSIPKSQDDHNDFYNKIQNKALDLESLGRGSLERESIENKVVVAGVDAHNYEKQSEMNKSSQALDASKQTENQAASYFDRNGAYCQNGQCSERQEEYARDFSDDASKLIAAAGEAQALSDTRDLNGKTMIFGGYAHQCVIRPIHFLDCCSNSGWGKDLNLANCTTEDLQLGHAKLQYRAHYIGEYCAKRRKFPGGSVCTQRKRTYCIFYTKIARIIREQGPYTQNAFSKSYGSPEYPDCSGFMPAELGFLNLSVVNFKDPIYPFDDNNPFGHSGSTEAGISIDLKPKDVNKDDLINKANDASQKEVQ